MFKIHLWLWPALVLAVGLQTASAAQQSHQAIRDQVRQFLADRVQSADAEVSIEVNALDQRLRLEQCKQPLHTWLPPNARDVGRVTVGVRCKGDKPWSLYLPARVRIFDQVVVAANELPRGEPIAASALKLERRDLSRLQRGYYLDIAEVSGKVAGRRIRRNKAISPSQVKTPMAVRRGATVSILAHFSGIEARMKGKALTPGGVGDKIRVENLSSGRELEARIVSAGTVKVDI